MPTPEEKYNGAVDFEGARLEVLPLHDRVVPGFINKVPILFQFVTGRDPKLRREPFSLAVVLDVSGSMSGSKLSSCKAAIAQLVDSTEDEDVLSLVAYDDRVVNVFERVRCGDPGARRDMKQRVNELKAGGSTNLYGGLLAGYEVLRQQAGAANNHIFLLSDGQANMGPIQKTEDILRAVGEWEEKIPILSYGIGDDFNERLMSPLGQVHRGSHYFYITDAASIEKLIARGVRALTGAVARNVRLHVRALSPGLWLPEHMIDGSTFLLVRERSVIQFLVELEVRPEVEAAGTMGAAQAEGAGGLVGWPCARRAQRGPARTAAGRQLSLAWEVQGFPLLAESRGSVALAVAPDGCRGPESEEARTFLDVRRGCELRRTAAEGANARGVCEQALRLFEGRLEHDRFGFAQEWADRTRALLANTALWAGGAAGAGAAKHLGVARARPCGQVVEEEEEEMEMDFDLFG